MSWDALFIYESSIRSLHKYSKHIRSEAVEGKVYRFEMIWWWIPASSGVNTIFRSILSNIINELMKSPLRILLKTKWNIEIYFHLGVLMNDSSMGELTGSTFCLCTECKKGKFCSSSNYNLSELSGPKSNERLCELEYAGCKWDLMTLMRNFDDTTLQKG